MTVVSRRARWREAWGRALILAMVTAYVAVLILGPIVALIAGAFREGLGAVVDALRQPEVLSAFRMTLLIGLITVAAHGLFGMLAAWVLVRREHTFPGRRLLDSLVDLPFAVSPVVAGYMLILLFGRNGWLAPLIDALGVRVVFAVPGMVLATLFVTLPFMIRELIPVLREFDVEQEHAAATLGASGWQTFWRVTFPALRWGFLYGISLTFARALGEFGAVLVVGGGVQGITETATLYIFRALEERQYTGATSAALALGLISLLLVLGTEWIRKAEGTLRGQDAVDSEQWAVDSG